MDYLRQATITGHNASFTKIKAKRESLFALIFVKFALCANSFKVQTDLSHIHLHS